MATYRADVTQSVEPAAPNYGTLAKGAEAAAAGARIQAESTSNLLRAGEFAAKSYIAYDISKSTAEAEDVTRQFAESSLKIDEAAANVQATPTDQTALDSNYQVINTYKSAVSRLKDATAGGMPVKEFVTRVNSIAREAIAKYPGLASEIRSGISEVTGLPKVDNWSEYVKSRFDQKQKEPAFDPMKIVAKDIEANFKTLGRTQEELYTLYNNDRPQYDYLMAKANQVNQTTTALKAVQDNIAQQRAQSDTEADQKRHLFPAVFHGTFAGFVARAQATDLEEIYRTNVELLSKGAKGVAADPVALDVQIQLHNTKMKTAIVQAKTAAEAELEKYFTNNPNISNDQRNAMRADIDRAEKETSARYADEKGIGLAAMSAVMVNYRDKSLKEQKDYFEMIVKDFAAQQQSSLSSMYWDRAGGRERLKIEYPEYYNMMEQRTKQIEDFHKNISSSVSDDGKLAKITDIVEKAKQDGKPTTPPPAGLDTPTNISVIKTANELLHANAVSILDKAVEGKTMTSFEKNMIRSAFTTNAESGANYKLLADRYVQYGDKIKLLPNTDQAVIKTMVSKGVRQGVMAITSVKEAVEAKHGVVLQMGVTSSGEIVAMPTPLSKEEQARQKALGITKIPLNDPRRKEPDAIKEFNAQTKALASNAVYSRAMLTGEDPRAIANEFGVLIMNRQSYKGFFDSAPVPVNTSNDFTGAQEIPAGALANQEAMKNEQEPPKKNTPTKGGELSVGMVVNGYRFTGGDPNAQSSWVKE